MLMSGIRSLRQNVSRVCERACSPCQRHHAETQGLLSKHHKRLSPLVDEARVITKLATKARVLAGQLREEEDAPNGQRNDDGEVDDCRQRLLFVHIVLHLRLHRPHVAASVLVNGPTNCRLLVQNACVRLGHFEASLLFLFLGLLAEESTQRLGVLLVAAWCRHKALRHRRCQQHQRPKRQHARKQHPSAPRHGLSVPFS
mmetsp:Transcript_23295/g.41224  ORF Transcript_23295/g.41224 Transcript_23295/m.41224 type:complete len:200 (-) Transcript_23295:23-622(-)